MQYGLADAAILGGAGVLVRDAMYGGFTVPVSGEYIIEFKGNISYLLQTASKTYLLASNKGVFDIYIEAGVQGRMITTETIVAPELKVSDYLEQLVWDSVSNLMDAAELYVAGGRIKKGIKVYEACMKIRDALPDDAGVLEQFSISVPVSLSAGTHHWWFALNSETIATALGLSGMYATSSIVCDLESVTITPLMNSYTIIATSGSNGSIDPEGEIPVLEGSDKTFNATPNTGFVVDRWYVDEQDHVGGISLLMFRDVQADRRVHVTFKSQASPLPDLILTELYPVPDPVANTFYAGQSVRWEVTVKNNSLTGSAASSYVAYYLGNSETDISENTRITHPDLVDLLSPGQSDSENQIYPFDSSDVGTKYLICKADYDNSIDESSEGNNTRVYGPFNVVQPTGYLTVNITPQQAKDDGARWRLTSGSDTNWHYSGDILSVETGSYSIEFKEVNGWEALESQEITITASGLTINAKYEFELGPDINRDAKVNLIDFSIMSNQWQDSTCIQPDWCEKADIDKSGRVDFNDLLVMVEDWLAHGANEQAEFIAPNNGSSPTIDGVLSDGEWGTSYTVTMDRVDGGGQHDIDLYFQNDGTFLFVGVDSQWGSGWDVVWDIIIDGDYSRTLNGNLSQPYTDINLCQQSPTGYPGYRAYRTFLSDTEFVRVGYGSGASSASSGSTNVSYEFRFPLADMDVVPGDSIGLFVSHGYDGTYEHLYELSASVSRTTPENWATLQIAP